ncbi:unnamed protein product [Dovyalis caffra]|uniref:Uncharacterized protein n=1 Tax=Dovyalis caffra TaxID=77055 RepID=A0AAV1RDQ3_9ROSI|nr:unnamed protein product [Dovyalis caffra]
MGFRIDGERMIDRLRMSGTELTGFLGGCYDVRVANPNDRQVGSRPELIERGDGMDNSLVWFDRLKARRSKFLAEASLVWCGRRG